MGIFKVKENGNVELDCEVSQVSNFEKLKEKILQLKETEIDNLDVDFNDYGYIARHTHFLVCYNKILNIMKNLEEVNPEN